MAKCQNKIVKERSVAKMKYRLRKQMPTLMRKLPLRGSRKTGSDGGMARRLRRACTPKRSEKPKCISHRPKSRGKRAKLPPCQGRLHEVSKQMQMDAENDNTKNKNLCWMEWDAGIGQILASMNCLDLSPAEQETCDLTVGILQSLRNSSNYQRRRENLGMELPSYDRTKPVGVEELIKSFDAYKALEHDMNEISKERDLLRETLAKTEDELDKLKITDGKLVEAEARQAELETTLEKVKFEWDICIKRLEKAEANLRLATDQQVKSEKDQFNLEKKLEDMKGEKDKLGRKLNASNRQKTILQKKLLQYSANDYFDCHLSDSRFTSKNFLGRRFKNGKCEKPPTPNKSPEFNANNQNHNSSPATTSKDSCEKPEKASCEKILIIKIPRCDATPLIHHHESSGASSSSTVLSNPTNAEVGGNVDQPSSFSLSNKAAKELVDALSPYFTPSMERRARAFRNGMDANTKDGRDADISTSFSLPNRATKELMDALSPYFTPSTSKRSIAYCNGNEELEISGGSK